LISQSNFWEARMKNCDNCRYMYDAGGESAEYVCELFGDDVPSEFAKEDGCCLHPMELKKAIRLQDRARDWCYEGYGQKLTERDKQMIQQTSQDFNNYMASLRRKYTEGNDGKETD